MSGVEIGLNLFTAYLRRIELFFTASKLWDSELNESKKSKKIPSFVK
jgi:hypothetical protein